MHPLGRGGERGAPAERGAVDGEGPLLVGHQVAVVPGQVRPRPRRGAPPGGVGQRGCVRARRATPVVSSSSDQKWVAWRVSPATTQASGAIAPSRGRHASPISAPRPGRRASPASAAGGHVQVDQLRRHPPAATAGRPPPRTAGLVINGESDYQIHGCGPGRVSRSTSPASPSPRASCGCCWCAAGRSPSPAPGPSPEASSPPVSVWTARRAGCSPSAGPALRDAYLEQLYTFDDPARDPRGRTVAVAYVALLPATAPRPALGRQVSDVAWAPE